MILTFSKQQFVDRIISGVKRHTIREDKTNRWKPGMKIHFWKGNPRNVKLNPYFFATGIVNETLKVNIYPNENNIYFPVLRVSVTKIESLNRFAISDGFDSWDEMKTWFKDDFKGKIIYFKNVEVLP